MSTKLTCKQAQKMIRAYLDDELNGRDSAAFISHIRNCETCRYELETSFIMDYAVQYLDEDKVDGFDIKGLLDKRSQEGEKRMATRRVLGILLWAAVIVMALAIIIILVMLLAPDFYSTIILPISRLLFT